MASKKILLITGPDQRHQYYINHLNHNFDIAGIIIENSNYPVVASHNSKEQLAWDWFFTRRKDYEKKHFKNSEKLYRQNQPLITTIPNSSLNSKETIKIINSIDPDLIAIFGSSIVGNGLIERYPKNIFNLHIGLSNEYRGSSCNFWPIYERRVDHLGATIIRINAGIDSGEILAQDRIELEVDDDEQTLAGKTVKLGVNLMINTIRKWKTSAITPILPSGKGKLFLQKHFDKKAVLKVKQIVEKGELKQLLEIQLKNERKD
ncbi:MAG: formyl transferase [Nitrospinales bacterium]